MRPQGGTVVSGSKLWGVVLFLLCGGTILQTAQASEGDRLVIYHECFTGCNQTLCSPDAQDRFEEIQTWAEKLLRWSCEEECGYQCMWHSIKLREEAGVPPCQFHGKWPLIRLYGIQEPASTLFSLLNGLSTAIGMVYFIRRAPPKAPMYRTWVFLGLTGINAWIWSTVFHSRDTPITEKLDYFSALAYVFTGLFTAISRVWFWRRSRRWTRHSAIVLVTVYIQHVTYMTFRLFDYGYNMALNVTAGLLCYGTWLIWFVRVRRRQPYIWSGLLTALLVVSFSALELFDTPPLFWVLDAHSLWHAGTIPCGFLWLRFCTYDCQHLQKLNN